MTFKRRDASGMRLHTESLKVPAFAFHMPSRERTRTQQQRIDEAVFAESTYLGSTCTTCGKPALRRVRAFGACRDHLSTLNGKHL